MKAKKSKESRGYELLVAEDIFDLYGCSFLYHMTSGDEKQICEFRIRDIHAKYINACKARIKAEAKFLGVGELEGFTIKKLLDNIGGMIQKDLESQSESMMMGGGFNLAASIIRANQAAGADLGGIDLSKYGIKADEPVKKASEIDENWFLEKSQGGHLMFNDSKWAVIARAYLKVESASAIDEIVEAIDCLNGCQHNSFHLLIDLQTGRMLENDGIGQAEAHKNLIYILNIKEKAKSPYEFVSRMSADVREMMQNNRGVA